MYRYRFFLLERQISKIQMERLRNSNFFSYVPVLVENMKEVETFHSDVEEIIKHKNICEDVDEFTKKYKFFLYNKHE
jgi:hypothetical protein